MNRLNTVAFGKGIFVAAGDSGTILTSTDGLTWTTQNSGTQASFTILNYSNSQYSGQSGVFVATFGYASSSVYFTSTTGSVWTEHTAYCMNFVNSVVYGNGKFVVVGSDAGGHNTSNDLIDTSSDGTNFSEAIAMGWDVAKGPGFTEIIYQNGLFVAGGPFDPGYFISNDGISWGVKTPPNYMASTVSYGDSMFIISDGTSIETSKDFVTWTKTNLPVVEGKANNSINSVAFGNGTFMAVGDHLVNLILTHNNFNNSYILIDSESVFAISVKSVLFANNTCIATGEDYSPPGSYYIESLTTSPNYYGGYSWAAHTSINTTSSDEYRGYSSIAFGNGLFAAVGNINSTRVISTSPDALTWTIIDSVTTSNYLHSVTYGSGSLSGQTGLFVAVGDSGIIMTSPNGAKWTKRNSGAYQTLNGVSYGNNQFIAVGNGLILASSDGLSWTTKKADTNFHLNGVSFCNDSTPGQAGLFVAVGNHGLVVTSPDGGIWTTQNNDSTYNLYSVAYGNLEYVAVGSNNTVLTSMSNNASSVLNHTTKPLAGGFKITVENNRIVAQVPLTDLREQLNIGLYNLSGKRIYSAPVESHNGVITLPNKVCPPGKYIMSITDGKKRALTAAVELSK